MSERRINRREVVLRLLAGPEMTMRQMALVCECEVSVVASTLRNLKHLGWVVGGPYRWQLTPQGREQVLDVAA